MCYRVNSDNSGKVTGVAYYGPDGSDNTIEAEIVILTPFIYDNTRLLLLSKTAKFPNGLANSSGELGKHLMAHSMPNVYVAVQRPARQQLHGPKRAEAHDRRLQRRQFRPQGSRLHSRLADLGRYRQPAGRPDQSHHHGAAARHPAVGRGLSRLRRELLSHGRWRWWRRPRTCPIPTRLSISIPT